MASIRQRPGVWQARVRRKGFPEEVESFNTKAEAQSWARKIESAMDQGFYQGSQQSNDILLTEIFQRYMQEITPSKRAQGEKQRESSLCSARRSGFEGSAD
jgi:hypothetical protein